MRFFLISDNTDTQTGMRLAGIEGVVAHTAEEVTNAFELALAQPDIGMILVTEKIADDFTEIVNDASAWRAMSMYQSILTLASAGSSGSSHRLCRPGPPQPMVTLPVTL